ncbi:MAG: sensor histidine kinase [Phycisphaerae bacterium]
MSRIRWYHFYFVLALFDVAVIMMSLYMHHGTLAGVRRLIQAEIRLDDQSDWLEHVRQRVVELNAPGNDVFHSKDVEAECKQFELASLLMDRALSDREGRSPSASSADIDRLNGHIGRLTTAARDIFAGFRAISAEPDVRKQERLLSQAGEAMARMDQAHHDALRTIARMEQPNSAERYELLQEHEQELASRFLRERFVIAAVVLILVGALFFGRKLQETDRALAAERTRVKEAQRERLAAIGELCSSVAHGIRNPLAAIRSSAQLVLDMGRLDAESRERLNDILSEGSRLGDRVTKLLNFARSNAESFETLDLQQLVDSAIHELKPQLKEREITLARDFEPRAIHVHADRHQIAQVVIELVSNAMEQSSGGDTIRVACRHLNGAGKAQLSVEDDGTGVLPAARDQVFNLFFTTKSTGTGIGLAAVRRIARLHGGNVELACPDGGGARFTVTLPLAPSRRAERTSKDGAHAA